MPERKPLIVRGEMTSVATCPPQLSLQQPALVDPSSHVMKSTPPLRNAAEPVIVGTTLRNQASHAASPQSCVAWHMLGVTQAKFAAGRELMSQPNCVNGTTCAAQRAGLLRMSM